MFLGAARSLSLSLDTNRRGAQEQRRGFVGKEARSRVEDLH